MSETQHALKVAVLALLALSGSAVARPGPDVIVGDLPDVTNFTTGGAVNGKRSYSVGTTSCNLGTQELTWNANTNQHPVISQNMYMLVNGRFTQIGQAWLKHGFCALQGTVCSTGCSPSPLGCGALGVLCSDPYSSGLNGTQSGLGPKSEVNAATGAFPYPFVNSGSGSGALFKRLQANDAEMGVANALYFVSSMYVQPEDAMAHNNNNNESYRRIVVTAGTKDITLTSTTQRERPGVMAWKDNGLGAGVTDPNILVTTIDVPGDGRFLVLSKATQLSATRYHYEYAIENLNSDRSAQSFTVPLPATANVTNAFFHDVEYHSGEPYDNTDWTNVVNSSSISWSGASFSTNPNANALRWDTVYTFAFDADGTPGQGLATLGMFKTGVPASVTGLVMLPGGGPPPPPSNDLCSGAAAISDGQTAFSNTGATSDAATEANCGSSAGIFNDIWYDYTANCAGTVSVSVCGATFDTKLAVYTACPATNNTAIACNDDSATCGVNSLQSALTFTATAGTHYKIRLGAFQNNSTGFGSGNITVTGPTCGPAGDFCASPIAMASNTASFDTTQATTDGPTETLCNAAGDNQVGKDVWYRWTAPCSGSVTVDTCTATFDTKLAVYSSCPTGPDSAVACNDDACGTGNLRSRVAFTATGGVNYLFRVGGYQSASGTGTLTVTPPVCGPGNDACANATTIASYGATTFNTTGTSTDGPAPTTCGTGNAIGNDIWFAYTTCVAGTHTVDTCTGGSFDSVVAVYSGTCGTPTIVACNDDACGAGGLSSTTTWTATANTRYLIRVGGYNGAVGAGTLTLAGPTCPPPAPANDNCQGRAGIGLGATPFTTVNATTDGPAHALCDNAGSNQITNDIWYNYPSQCNGRLTVDTCTNTNFDSKIAIYAYDGTCATINDSTLIACNDDACGTNGLASRLVIPVHSGQNYAIRIGGFNGATGTGSVTLTCTVCPCDWNHNGVLNSQDFFDFINSFFAFNADFNSDGQTNSQDMFDFLTCFFALPTGCI